MKINCPECGKEISDTAVNCPHCGYNLKAMSPKSFKLIFIILMCVVVFGIFGYVVHNNIEHDKKIKAETQQLKEANDKLQKDMDSNNVDELKKDVGQ